MSLEIVILSIAILLILQAFFAGSEIALISCDKIKIRSLAENGSRSAKLVLSAYKDVDKYLSTSLLGINLALLPFILKIIMVKVVSFILYLFYPH